MIDKIAHLLPTFMGIHAILLAGILFGRDDFSITKVLSIILLMFFGWALIMINVE